MSVKNRLKEFIKSQSITISSFEKLINVANGYVNSISKGIGSDKMTIILEKYPNLNPEWLLTGNGEMLKGDPADYISHKRTDVKEATNEMVELLQQHVKALTELGASKEKVSQLVAENKDLERKIEDLKKEIEDLKKEIEELKKSQFPKGNYKHAIQGND